MAVINASIESSILFIELMLNRPRSQITKYFYITLNSSKKNISTTIIHYCPSNLNYCTDDLHYRIDIVYLLVIFAKLKI